MAVSEINDYLVRLLKVFTFMRGKVSVNGGRHQVACKTLAIVSLVIWLGRSPRKNCKNDLDDQT
jgi:hypothetical protein